MLMEIQELYNKNKLKTIENSCFTLSLIIQGWGYFFDQESFGDYEFLLGGIWARNFSVLQHFWARLFYAGVCRGCALGSIHFGNDFQSGLPASTPCGLRIRWRVDTPALNTHTCRLRGIACFLRFCEGWFWGPDFATFFLCRKLERLLFSFGRRLV